MVKKTEFIMNYLIFFAICIIACATVNFIETMYDINHNTKKTINKFVWLSSHLHQLINIIDKSICL